MLKVPDERTAGGGDCDLGDLLKKLLDDSRAFARAEVDLAKTIAAEKAAALKVALILLVAAAFIVMGAINALCIGIFFAFDAAMGPILAGIVSFVLIGIVAAIVAWIGVRKLMDSL